VNIQKMMRQAQEMQEKIARELAEMEVEGTAGGGMVRIRMDGTKQVRGMSLDPEVVDPEEVEMLQDLIVAALHDAANRAEEAAKEKLGGALGGALGGGLPGLGNLLG
jgi:DNA-binding YbaB/EbfC family protein